mmetsp:Transcript_20552/g.50691  ORF Transcript_20552/g.50691 Transcript_20552/m.50691 type:complete len:100 (-) Transcript_20552:70-369(-)
MDGGLVIVDKPAGMPSIPTRDDYVENAGYQLSAELGEEVLLRPVSRLEDVGDKIKNLIHVPTWSFSFFYSSSSSSSSSPRSALPRFAPPRPALPLLHPH